MIKTHLDIWKFLRNVLNPLSTAEDGKDLDLRLVETPICKHAERGDGGTSRSYEGWDLSARVSEDYFEMMAKKSVFEKGGGRSYERWVTHGRAQIGDRR